MQKRCTAADNFCPWIKGKICPIELVLEGADVRASNTLEKPKKI